MQASSYDVITRHVPRPKNQEPRSARSENKTEFQHPRSVQDLTSIPHSRDPGSPGSRNETQIQDARTPGSRDTPNIRDSRSPGFRNEAKYQDPVSPGSYDENQNIRSLGSHGITNFEDPQDPTTKSKKHGPHDLTAQVTK